MKSDEVGTTLKHPEIINDNVKNLIASIFGQTYSKATFFMLDNIMH
jgi:hypothetical protein